MLRSSSRIKKIINASSLIGARRRYLERLVSLVYLPFQVFDDAERTDAASLLQGCGACLTGYLVYMCVDTPYEKHMKLLAQYIHEQNENVFVPRGLVLTNPMERGLRVLEITIVGPN